MIFKLILLKKLKLTILLIWCIDYFVAIYQRFDGIILPEHIIKFPKPKSSGGWFSGPKEDPTTCNGVKLSSFGYNTEDLRTDNHKELRKDALLMHLHSMHDVLVGTKSMDDPVCCIEVICSTYLSLHNYYLCFKRAYGLSCHDWKFNETTKVWCIEFTYMWITLVIYYIIFYCH